MKLSPVVLEYVADYERQYNKKPSVTALQLIERAARLGLKLEIIGRKDAQAGHPPFQKEYFQNICKQLSNVPGECAQECAQILSDYLQDCYMTGFNSPGGSVV